MSDRAVLVVLDSDLHDPQPALRKGVRLARACGAPLELYLNTWNSAMARGIGLDSIRLERAIRSVMHGWEKRLRKLLDELDAGDAEIHLTWDSSDFPFLADLILSREPRTIVVHAEESAGVKRMLFTPRHWRLLRKAPAPVLCVGEADWVATPSVVAAVDVDEAEEPLTGAIIREARRLADQLEASLTLVHVVEFPDEALLTLAESDLVVTLPDQGEMVAEKGKALEALARQHGILAENTRVLEGNPAQALSSHLEAHPGVLVMGTVYRGMVKRLLMGSTAERILRQSDHDVLVIKPDDFVSPWRTGESRSPG